MLMVLPAGLRSESPQFGLLQVRELGASFVCLRPGKPGFSQNSQKEGAEPTMRCEVWTG